MQIKDQLNTVLMISCFVSTDHVFNLQITPWL
jgi:hypothetical protein